MTKILKGLIMLPYKIKFLTVLTILQTIVPTHFLVSINFLKQVKFHFISTCQGP